MTETGVAGIVFTEAWWTFPEEWLPNVIAFAEGQHDRFRAEALDIQRRLRYSEPRLTIADVTEIG